MLQVEGKKLGREKFLQHLYSLQFFCEPLQVSQLLINFLSSTDAGKAIIQSSLQGYESNAVTLATDDCFYIIGANRTVIIKLLAVIQSKVGEKHLLSSRISVMTTTGCHYVQRSKAHCQC